MHLLHREAVVYGYRQARRCQSVSRRLSASYAERSETRQHGGWISHRHSADSYHSLSLDKPQTAQDSEVVLHFYGDNYGIGICSRPRALPFLELQTRCHDFLLHRFSEECGGKRFSSVHHWLHSRCHRPDLGVLAFAMPRYAKRDKAYRHNEEENRLFLSCHTPYRSVVHNNSRRNKRIDIKCWARLFFGIRIS